jgi:hypothetical protein
MRKSGKPSENGLGGWITQPVMSKLTWKVVPGPK